MRRHRVWDYSRANIAALTRLGIEEDQKLECANLLAALFEFAGRAGDRALRLLPGTHRDTAKLTL